MVALFQARGRFFRAALILLAGWLLLETALLQLVAARIGWGATLVFLSIKGGIGLFLIGFLTIRGFSRLRQNIETKNFGGLPGSGSLRAIFGIASGILITLPGLIPPLLGVILFSPSVQQAVLKRFLGAASGTAEKPRSKEFDLEADEWQEIRRKKLATKARPRKASLEAKPPSV